MQDGGERPEQRAAGGGRRQRLERLLGDRSLSVYGVLLAGAAVLAVLLGIVWVTGRGGGTAETPTCLDVDLADANEAVGNGLVEQLRIVTDQEQPERGALAVEMRLNDGATCWQLPQGVANHDALNQIIGVAAVYNEVRAGEQRIGFRWEQPSNIPAALLATATPSPTATPLPTRTPLPVATPAPTATPFPSTATPLPTMTPRPPTFPIGVASPSAIAAPAPEGDAASPGP